MFESGEWHDDGRFKQLNGGTENLAVLKTNFAIGAREAPVGDLVRVKHKPGVKVVRLEEISNPKTDEWALFGQFSGRIAL